MQIKHNQEKRASSKTEQQRFFQKRVPWNAKIVFNEVVMGEDKWEEARAAAHRGAQGSLLPGSTLVFCAVNDWGGNLLKALHSSATRHDWVL